MMTHQMRAHRLGFSLIELLIALALSSIIMLGLVQANKNAGHLLKEAQSLLVVNRQVALLYNQLERDVTAGMVYQKPVQYVPAKAVDKKEESGSKQQAESPIKEADSKKTEKEKYIPSCTLEPYEEGGYRVGSKKWQQTKKMSIISTTPLDVYEQDHERMVRIGYELVYDKKMSTPQKNVYVLYRMQTDELENVQFKEDENKKTKTVSRCIVSDHIKQFSLEAAYDQRPPEKKENQSASSEQEKKEQIKTFVWTEKEEKEKSKTVLPDHFLVHIELLDTSLSRSYSFSCLLPVLVKIEAAALKKEEKKTEAVAPAGKASSDAEPELEENEAAASGGNHGA